MPFKAVVPVTIRFPVNLAVAAETLSVPVPADNWILVLFLEESRVRVPADLKVRLPLPEAVPEDISMPPRSA